MKLILLYYSLSNLLSLALADPPYSSCSNSTLKSISFQNNLNTLLSTLPSNANVSDVYNKSIRSDADSVYVQFMCLNFMRSDSCSICVRTAAQDVKNLCPQDREATVWEEDCQLRYSNRDFLGHLDVSGNQPYANKKNFSGDQGMFMSVVNETLSNLTARAAFDSSSGMYATGEVSLGNGDTLYALVQCTTDLSPGDCQICLEVGLANVSRWFYDSRGARLLSHSCYLRYELYPFYDQDTAGVPSSSQVSPARKRSVWKITVISASSVLLAIALAGSAFYCLVRNRKLMNQIADQEVQLHSISEGNCSVFQQQSFQGIDGLDAPESGYIDLNSILAATNDFSDSNLLGHGGFGPVYKGVLLDGKEVAVKRLASFSEQGDEEFTNEVLLIMKLQHKNLVKLLGYCIDGKEKLLVYEFMPNSSLDAVLFDPKNRQMLDWSKRINIVDGIAKGLLYLHEDSRLKIIHRDLKASNVLLDNEMNPVISDFGTARIFAAKETNANTAKIVGTYGYMAPEYAMEGVYSIKSDVFSFGVLLLETITGIRNMGFQNSNASPSLVSFAWRSWKEGNLMELVDPSLQDSCRFEELSRHVHVGLLCVQEDAEDRPNMSSVVSMLNSETTDLPQPEVPAFSLVRFGGNQESDDNSWSINRLTLGSDLDD